MTTIEYPPSALDVTLVAICADFGPRGVLVLGSTGYAVGLTEMGGSVSTYPPGKTPFAALQSALYNGRTPGKEEQLKNIHISIDAPYREDPSMMWKKP